MDEESKIKHSKRRQKTRNHIQKEVRIAKAHGIAVDNPHELHKRSAMNCGNPKCPLCSNPRKTYKELTIQEQKLFQDLDTERDRNSNGI